MAGQAPGPPSERTWWLPWIGVACLVAMSFASVWWATSTGALEGALLNGDEVVAALLPHTFAEDGPTVIFPGNAYQGLVEVPAYAVIEALGGGMPALRLLHQACWVGAVVVWSAATWVVVGADRPVGRGGRGWVLFTVLGLVGVTSLVGWQVWFHVYPGYQVGALLSGLAVLVGARSVRAGVSRPAVWLGAGVLAGLAIYAQPMHAAGAVCLGVLALGAQDRVRATTSAVFGAVVGVAPWVWWNVAHDMSVLDDRATPVQHPEWGYADRVANTARITVEVLFGDERIRGQVPAWVVACQVVAAVALVVLGGVGVVVLVRSWRRSAALLAGVVVMLPGLSALPTFSLSVDERYAVAWWPALVVLVAAGAVRCASLGPPWRTGVRVAVVAAVVCHVAGAIGLAAPAISARAARPDAVELTADLGEDLRRCGVELIAGGYWSVYPAQWGADGELRVSVINDTERLPPPSRREWQRDVVALLTSRSGPTVDELVEIIARRHGRGASGWTTFRHVPSGVTVLLESGVAPPEGCVSPSGLTPVT